MLKQFKKQFFLLILAATLPLPTSYADNQTPDVSPILPGQDLPFEVKLDQADFSLPIGWHSGATAIWEGKWLLIAGRINGLHGFSNGDDNFPPDLQNAFVIVVDPSQKRTYSRSLSDPGSGLSQSQIDLLSVTSPQFVQKKKQLYITGGYGVDSSTGLFSTKPFLTAINIPGLMRWAMHPESSLCASKFIRQISHPLFQVTGGALFMNGNVALQIFGQNFSGYYTPGSNGNYTQQVIRFKIVDDGRNLSIIPKTPIPLIPDPNFRRRDLNVIGIMQKSKNRWQKEGFSCCYEKNFVALSGVFTLTGGAWTVPVIISSKGEPKMADPELGSTFKQGMNNYASAKVNLFSEKTGDNYLVIFGGITYGYFDNGVFETDDELPFTNQITTILVDKRGEFSQYLMDTEYPLILSTHSNPGNPLLFGAGARFFPSEKVTINEDYILDYDGVEEGPVEIGYVVGGIQSTLPNTNFITDSSASPYIFKISLTKKKR